MGKKKKVNDDYMTNCYGNNSRGSLLTFFAGIAIFAVGAYMVLQNTSVSSGFGLSSLFGVKVSFGVVMVPVLIGIIMLFFNAKSILGWILFIGGLIFILIGILMGLRIHFRTVSSIEAIIMYGCMAAGIGVTLKGLFGKN